MLLDTWFTQENVSTVELIYPQVDSDVPQVYCIGIVFLLIYDNMRWPFFSGVAEVLCCNCGEATEKLTKENKPYTIYKYTSIL